MAAALPAAQGPACLAVTVLVAATLAVVVAAASATPRSMAAPLNPLRGVVEGLCSTSTATKAGRAVVPFFSLWRVTSVLLALLQLTACKADSLLIGMEVAPGLGAACTSLLGVLHPFQAM